MLFEMCIQKTHDRWIRHQAIDAFDQPVALIFEAQIFDGHLALAQGGHDLLGLANRHAGIVRTVYHEKRRDNLVHMPDGRALFQKLAIILQAAILRFAQLASPGMGILQE